MPVRRTLLSESPALSAYITRIGAEELNFCRFMVKEYRDHYYIERTLITIDAEGEIYCSSPELSPTDEERETIKEELRGVEFPTSVKARTIETLIPLLRFNERYEFRDKDGDDGIIMVQERGENAEGRKFFLTWTFFSDGVWRLMEPNGPLPFWRPERDERRRRRIMIHEGAKAARAADRIVREGENHPWLDRLSDYEHWGMIGGALAPHRSDYNTLRRQNAIEVAYVCDNDYEGKSALQKVSRCYGRSLRGIMFGNQWPPTWDMGDPMPPAMFDAQGKFTGPDLDDLVTHATHATTMTTITTASGKQKSVATLSRHFAEEWLHSLEPDVYLHKVFPDRIYTGAVFNDLVAPFSDVTDTAALVKKDNAIKCPILKYDPSREPGVYVSADGRLAVNTHRPGPVKFRQGSAEVWEDFLKQLVPDDHDRMELSRFAATFIHRPDLKMHYGVLLISDAQGVGKTTFGDVLATLAGRNNASFPSETSICDSRFNDWMAHKRIAVVNEIYAGKSAKAYNKLKNVITDPTIPIEIKFMQPYQIDNWLHVVACSNSMRALKLDNMDRRWLVPEVTEIVKSKDYWRALYRWLQEEGGFGIVKTWAKKFLETNEAVFPGEPAPWTKRKQDVIEEGYSQGQQLVMNFIRYVKAKEPDDVWLRSRSMPEQIGPEGALPGGMFFDVDLVEMIKEVIYQGRQSDYLERPLTVRKVAKSEGCYVHPEGFGHKSHSHARLIVASPFLADQIRAMGRAEILQLMRSRTKVLGIDEMREWTFGG